MLNSVIPRIFTRPQHQESLNTVGNTVIYDWRFRRTFDLNSNSLQRSRHLLLPLFDQPFPQPLPAGFSRKKTFSIAAMEARDTFSLSFEPKPNVRVK